MTTMLRVRANAAVILAIVLPLAAVVASVGTAMVALSRGDPPLPGQYHWEGNKLDLDFAQSMRAAALHLNATVDLQPSQGACHLTLHLDGGNPPAVDLALIHPSNPALDRTVRFSRTSGESSYTAVCTPLSPGRWHVELSDPQRSWSFRSATSGGQPGPVILSSNSVADD